jgi:hypothetical protein
MEERQVRKEHLSQLSGRDDTAKIGPTRIGYLPKAKLQGSTDGALTLP